MNRIPRIKPSFVVRSSYGDSAPFRTVESALDYIAGALKDRAVADGRYDETAVIIAATGETEESAPFADYVQPEDLRRLRSPSVSVDRERERAADFIEEMHESVSKLFTQGRTHAAGPLNAYGMKDPVAKAVYLRELRKVIVTVLAAHPDTLNLADDIERHFKR